MIALLAAFQFLTIFPPVIRRAFTLGELGRATAYYPVVGLALGGVLYGLGSGLMLVLPPVLTAAITLAAWIILTRALHFDGFLDTVDGLFGGFTPERRLEIMRDSLVGAFGVAGGGLLLLVKFSAIYALPGLSPGLLLAPVLGRWGITLAVIFYPYAREKGLGRDIKDHAGWPQALVATTIVLVTAWLAAQWSGIAVCALVLVVVISWLGFVRSRIPGMTGDIYGATCEIIEVITLVIFSAAIFA
jgi:adenosylcobinamide-GDP ribazoletransferase